MEDTLGVVTILPIMLPEVLTVSQLLKSNWLTGPAFLWQTEDEWPKAPEAKTLPSDAFAIRLSTCAGYACSFRRKRRINDPE